MGLLTNLKNVFREQVEKASEATSDPERDTRFAIADGEKQCNQFRDQIRDLNSANRQSISERDGKQAQLDNRNELAANAAAQNEDADALELLTQAESLEIEIQALDTQIETNQAAITQMRADLKASEIVIQTAKGQLSLHKAEMHGAEMSRKLAQSRSRFASGTSGLSAVNKLKHAAEKAKADAAATKEEIGLQPENLAARMATKYGKQSTSVADKLEKLKEKQTKKATASAKKK